MNEEKDFFKTCFNTVAGLEVKNESESIAKEVVLSEIERLEQENEQLIDNWNKLKEYCKENTLCYEVGDDENTKLIGSRIHGLNVLDKMQELEQGSDNK